MGKKLCICQICTCGRHRCPHRPNAPITSSNQPCVLTEYANRYIPHPMEERKSFKPEMAFTENPDPLVDATTFKTDYIAHPLDRPKAFKPDDYRKPEGDMDMTTSYKKEYIEKRGPPVKAIKPDHSRKVGGKFEGEPTYRNDYRKWPLGRPEAVRMEEGWKPPTDEFGGETTFQHDFINHPIPMRKSYKPDEAAKSSDAPFEDATDYRQSYIRHPLPPRQGKMKADYAPPKAGLDGMTTFKRDYTEHPLDKPESFKPQAGAYQSDAPFEDSTNYKNDFKLWPSERPAAIIRDDWVKPEGDMYFNTTQKTDFLQHPMARTAAIKPQRGRKVTAPFEGNTNYREDFRKWPADMKQKPMMQQPYVPPEAPFQGMSQYQSQFIPHPMMPAQAIKPTEEAKTVGDFDDATMYRIEYTPKASDPCEAGLLESTQSKYVYRDQDARGHKYYQPLAETLNKMGKSPQMVPS